MRKRLSTVERGAIRYAADDLVHDSRAGQILAAWGQLKVTPERRRVLIVIARELYKLLGVRSCEGCGCTEELACAGGCGWTRAEWCSQCAPPSKPPPAKKRRKS